MKKQDLHPIEEKKTRPGIGDASIFLIGVRKIVQISTAAYTALLKGLANLQAALDPKIAQALKVITPIQMTIYGLYTLLSSIVAAKRLYHLHTNTGAYKNKPANKKKKVKTTIFTGSMALSDISVFIFTILTLAGVATMTSPAGIALILINGLVNLTKYSLKFFTLAIDYLKSTKSIKDKIALKYDLINNVLKFTMATFMMTAMVAVLFIVPPLSTIVAASILALWSVSKLVYKYAIRPKLDIKRAAEEAALSSEPEEFDLDINKLSTFDMLNGMTRDFTSMKNLLDKNLNEIEEKVVDNPDNAYTTDTVASTAVLPINPTEVVNDRKATL